MSETIASLLSSGQLFDPNPGAPSPYYAVVGFIFAVVLGGSISLFLRREKLAAGKSELLRLMTRIAIAGMAVGGVGVVLTLARFLAIPVLSMRILLYLTIVAAVGLAIYLIYYTRRVYPRRRSPGVRATTVPRSLARTAARKKKGKRRR